MNEATAVRAYNKVKAAKAEREQLDYIEQGHWSIGESYRQRVTYKKVKHLLLSGADTIIRKGTLCRMRVDKLGFGVYEISFPYPKELEPDLRLGDYVVRR